MKQRLATFLLMIFAPLVLTHTAAAGPTAATLPGLTLDLQRYSGDWRVQASIPIGIPFFSDKYARNYTERYELNEDGSIRLICAFDDTAKGKQRRFEFKGFLQDDDPTRSTWKVQFVWPIRATYRVLYIDESYETTIVGDGKQRYAWIMTRDNQLSDADYEALLDIVEAAGYAREDFRRIAHDS